MTAVELTLLEALCRSRQQILNELLPVFKSKRRSVKPGRRGAVPPEPPVHTLSALCTTNVVIGPHTFRHSKLYAADWGTGGATKRRMSSAASSAGPAALTPAMIARLNAASAVDSSLASILRKAATGSANAKELAQLAREIEKLRAEDAALAAGNADQPVASTSKNVSGEDKSNDPPAIVIEFAEAPEELYQVPSHYMFSALPNARSETRRSAGAPSASDALLSFFVFASDEEGTPDAIPVPVDLIVEGLSQDVSSELLQCSRAGRPKNAKLEKWWKEMIRSVPPRAQLVRPGTLAAAQRELLAQAQAGADPPPISSYSEKPNMHGKRAASDSVSATPVARPKSGHKRQNTGRGSSHTQAFASNISPSGSPGGTPQAADKLTPPTSRNPTRTRAPSRRALETVGYAEDENDDWKK